MRGMIVMQGTALRFGAAAVLTVALCLAAPEGSIAMTVAEADAHAASERTYQRFPAQTPLSQKGLPQNTPLVSPDATEQPSSTAPPAKPAETRGKYSNPYDRRIPLQGDTHKGYAPARRDPFNR